MPQNGKQPNESYVEIVEIHLIVTPPGNLPQITKKVYDYNIGWVTPITDVNWVVLPWAIPKGSKVSLNFRIHIHADEMKLLPTYTGASCIGEVCGTVPGCYGFVTGGPDVDHIFLDNLVNDYLFEPLGDAKDFWFKIGWSEDNGLTKHWDSLNGFPAADFYIRIISVGEPIVEPPPDYTPLWLLGIMAIGGIGYFLTRKKKGKQND